MEIRGRLLMLKINAELLEILERDTEKFEHFFLEQQFLYPLANLRKNRNDQRLQLLLQQLIMGLPINSILESYPTLGCYVNQIQPIIDIPAFSKKLNVVRQCFIQDILIFADYDLLLINGDQATAISWTTEKSFFETNTLENSWETQLQLYLLAETENLPPQNLSIFYLFISPKDSPSIHQFTYNQEKYNLFKGRLEKTLLSLSSLLKIKQPCPEIAKNSAEINLQKLFNGEFSIPEYLSTVPEVEI